MAGGEEGTEPPRGSQWGASEKVVKRCCSSVTHGKLHFLSAIFFSFFFLFIYLDALGLSCDMRDLVL